MHDGAPAVADCPVAQVGVADAAELIAAEHALMIENPKSYRQYEGAIGVSSRRPGKCGRKMTRTRANAITLFTGALQLDDSARWCASCPNARVRVCARVREWPSKGRGLHTFLCDALCVTENVDDTRHEPLSGGLGERPDTARSVSSGR